MKIYVTALEALREKERGDETQVYYRCPGKLACTFYIDGRKIRWRYHLPMSDKVILVALWFFPQASCCLGPFCMDTFCSFSTYYIIFRNSDFFFKFYFSQRK